MKDIGALTREELGAWVAECLQSKGIEVVLTGGSCVSIYSDDAYVSMDLDFVDITFQAQRKIKEAVLGLGFENLPLNSRHFVHPETPLTIEFPAGPLMVGDEHIKPSALNEVTTTFGILRMLSPTDCVKDRLAHYLHFKDNQCLEQAMMVAKRHKIHGTVLREWLMAEGASDQIEAIFLNLGLENS